MMLQFPCGSFQMLMLTQFALRSAASDVTGCVEKCRLMRIHTVVNRRMCMQLIIIRPSLRNEVDRLRLKSNGWLTRADPVRCPHDASIRFNGITNSGWFTFLRINECSWFQWQAGHGRNCSYHSSLREASSSLPRSSYIYGYAWFVCI